MSLSHLLHQRIQLHPDNIACIDYDQHGKPHRQLSYRELGEAVDRLSARLHAALLDGTPLVEDYVAPRPIVGIVVRNSCDWLIADLACLFANITSLPLPQAFTRAQAEHLAAKCTLFLLDKEGETILTQRWGLLPDDAHKIRVDHTPDTVNPLDVRVPQPHLNHHWVCKIIHTSGTTSRPKGVCLSEAAIGQTLQSLLEVIPEQCHQHYLSLVPLSLLLEQITALYMPLLSGGTVHFLPPEVPLLGEPGSNADTILDWLVHTHPTATTVPPIVVQRLLARLEQGDTAPSRALRRYLASAPHITCGGAAINPAILARLQELGVAVYQGYGLSENASVVSVNTPAANKLGSVGRPLPHVKVRIDTDTSIHINSASLFSHYSGEDPSACARTSDGWLDTGDLGSLDEEGFLYVHGRKKNVICLPNGRNVCPEQIELGLRQLDGIHDAVVFLDEHDGLIALLNTTQTSSQAEWLTWLNLHLSDIERPSRLWLLPRGSQLLSEFYTVTGRPQRTAIAQRYSTQRTHHQPSQQEIHHDYGHFVSL